MQKTNKEKELTDSQLTRLLLKKIGPVDMHLVISEKEHNGKHMIVLNGKRAEDGEAVALKREADLLVQTRLWKIFTETLRYQAQKEMFEKSQRSEDIFVSGKFLLHAISTLEHIVAACQNPLLLSDQKPPMKVVHRGRVDKI